MLQRDAVQLYELPEAGRLLYRDPARLAREARRLRIPSARVGEHLGLPAPWVDAESGTSAADADALRVYWLARLAPPSPDARRPQRARDRLPVDALLAPEEAARRLFATPKALARLDGEGTLPSLRVDGAVCYDAALVDLLARAPEADEETEDIARTIEARRAEVLAWARFEYETRAAGPAAPPAPSESGPSAPSGPEAPDAADTPAVDTAAADAPTAYEIPADLPGGDGPPPSRLIDVEGFETLDED